MKHLSSIFLLILLTFKINGQSIEKEITIARADSFLKANNGNGGHRAILAQTLMDGKDDPSKPDELKDFFLLDIRRPADFETGQIAGSVNIQMQDITNPENLEKLPSDKPILIICNSGHTASVTNAILCMLGYDAWTLKFGMMSWRSSTSIQIFDPSIKAEIGGAGYPLVKGSN